MTGSIEQQIQEVEVNIEAARSIIAKGDAIDRLYQNKDFQEIIIQGYLKDEAHRLALLSGVPHLDPLKGANILRDIQAIGTFYAFLDTTLKRADQMREDVGRDLATLDELRAHEGQED